MRLAPEEFVKFESAHVDAEDCRVVAKQLGGIAAVNTQVVQQTACGPDILTWNAALPRNEVAYAFSQRIRSGSIPRRVSRPAVPRVLRTRVRWSFSTSENGGHHARVAPSVHHGHNPQGLLVRRIRNQVFAYNGKAQGARSQVRAPVALMRKTYKPANGGKSVLSNTAGSLRTILRDKCPNVGDVLGRKRVKSKPCATVIVSSTTHLPVAEDSRRTPRRRWVSPCRF
jgi:hypothetical protein